MEKSVGNIDEKILKSSVVIVDVEGTTTSISFVKEKLFPYATEKVADFLEAKWEVKGVQEAVEGMRQQAILDVKAEVEGAVPIPDKESSKEEQISGVAGNLKWLISIDNKGTHLKQLSGLIWEEGYTKGDIKGHVYDDVQPCLEKWRGMGKRLYVYSSGSVLAQRLLLRHSTAGDLAGLMDDHFDTAVGGKRESQSYTNIVSKIACQPEEAVFLTDVVEEASAAREAGLNTVLVVRDGNAPLSAEDRKAYCCITSFQDLPMMSSSTKRKQDSAPEEELPPTKVAKTVPESTEINVLKENEKTEEISSETMEVDVVQEKVESETNSVPVPEINGAKVKESCASEVTPEPTPPVEKVVEEKIAIDEPIVETKNEEKHPKDSKGEAMSATPAETKDTVEEVKAPAKDIVPIIPVKESESGNQPSDETEAVPADECKQKTDTDKCSDKAQEPEIMETDGEEIVDKKCDGIVEVTKVPKEKGTPLPESVEKDKTESVVEEKDVPAVKESKEAVSTDDPAENDVKSGTNKMDADEASVEKDAPKDTVTDKVDTKETVSIEKDLNVPSEELIEDVEVCAVEQNQESNGTTEKELSKVDTDINEKLNKLLGEEGAALEKACDDILSKVDEMTSKGVTTGKAFIEKAIAEKESVRESVTETPSENNEESKDLVISSPPDNTCEKKCTINNGKTTEKEAKEESSLAEEKENATPIADTKSSDKPTVPELKLDKSEESPSEPKEVASNATEKKTNGAQECLNGKSTDVNGKSTEESKVQNGNSKETETEPEDRLKASNGTAAEEKPATEQIKLKKVPTEDLAEQAIQQVAET